MSLGTHEEPLQLLWNAPRIAEPGFALTYPRTDALPWTGITLQRNPSTVNNSVYGLMCFVGGAAHVHGRASGMSMELFGLGQVMGAKAGRDTCGSAIHENYYRLFSANNTIIVHGRSRGSGGREAYQQPGWRYFTDRLVSYPHSQPARARFNAPRRGRQQQRACSGGPTRPRLL